jgi:signal transduction histidine kinase
MNKRRHVSRAMVLYLGAIVAPALVVLFLGFRSLAQQRHAVNLLVETNRRLSEQKVAAELEGRVRGIAAECLRLQSLSPPFLQAHPIARHYFFIEDGEVRWPRIRTPPPANFPDLPAPVARAEELELRDGRIREALAAYREAFQRARLVELRALVLSRIARCEEKLNEHKAALASWKALLENSGSSYDPSHRPYSITARLELGQVDGLYDEITSGRWDLSAEQFDYYLSRLGRQPPPGNRFEFARELEGQFRHAGPLVEGEMYRSTLPHHQLWYMAKRGRILGLAVSSKWVAEKLEPEVRASLGLESMGQLQPASGVWLYAGGTLLVIVLLAAGVVLLLRDVHRESRTNQLRADFVSGVSHELKTPLTLIRLYADILMNDENHPQPERSSFYRIIARESERLSHLIERVLSFSRIERGQQNYTLETGDLGPVVSRTVDAYQHYLRRLGFEIDSQLTGELPPVRFDPDAVSQAIVNLLDNAIKYSGGNKFVRVNLATNNGHVALEVEDRGIGIAPEWREKVFERFCRAPNASAKGGYGLGLYLVRHIMNAHGGDVQLESEMGRGSRFRLVFPVAS